MINTEKSTTPLRDLDSEDSDVPYQRGPLDIGGMGIVVVGDDDDGCCS